MHVPVIVLNWNGWDQTAKCIASLSRCADCREIWLVDNGSDEDRTSEFHSQGKLLRGVRLDRNFGWAGGYNRALALAFEEGYEMAYLLNNDTLAESGFLTATVEAMDENDRLAAVGSLIVYADRNWVKFDGRYYHPRQKKFKKSPNMPIRTVNRVNGAGMLIRLNAYQLCNFDELFFCYWEETDWCWGMLDRGWKVSLVPSSVVYHFCEGSNVGANSRYYRYRNRFLILHKHSSRVPWRTKEDLAELTLREANKLKNKSAYCAMVEAVRDGLRGHFGQRGTSYENRSIEG